MTSRCTGLAHAEALSGRGRVPGVQGVQSLRARPPHAAERRSPGGGSRQLKHFFISETTILDPGWLADYTQYVPPLVERYGGSYFARAGEVALLEGEGDAPQFYSILSFPTRESAEGFYNSPEYEPYKRARQAGARSRILVVSWDETAS